jgi:hypothetical protein
LAATRSILALMASIVVAPMRGLEMPALGLPALLASRRFAAGS